MNVLSLFDGISCGQVALQRAGIAYDNYYASEIDKYAIQITQKNFPKTIQLGDVKQVWARNLPKIDLLIGGSPCQDLSIAKNNRQGLNGARSGLFWHYIRLLRTCKPKYFLLENVASMPKEAKAIITKELGVEPILINSALVSAQQRKRLYWTNIPNITQPEDKGIVLKDVLETGVPYSQKAHSLTASYNGAIFPHDYLRKQKEMVEEPIPCALRNRGNGKQPEFNGTNKANSLTTVQTDSMVMTTLRLGEIGNNSQGNRIYSVRGKSVSLNANGGGMGAKTGLYKIDLPDGDYTIRKLTPVECERLQTLPDNYTEKGVSYYYQNIFYIINLVMKGEQLCKNVKSRDAKIQYQTEKQGYAINIIYDISDMEPQNLLEILLKEKKSVLLTDVISCDKQEKDIVLSTIKDLKEQVQQNLIKENLKDVNIAIDWLLQENCVIGTIKIGYDTEMQNIQIKLEKEQITTDIKNLKENIECNIEKLLQKYWAEISHLKKLCITLIWINSIIIRKIYMCVIKKNTQAYINSLIKLQDNLLDVELSNLKMVDIIPISSTQRYKCLGNGWTVDVIAHIFSFLPEEFKEKGKLEE